MAASVMERQAKSGKTAEAGAQERKRALGRKGRPGNGCLEGVVRGAVRRTRLRRLNAHSIRSGRAVLSKVQSADQRMRLECGVGFR